MSIKCFFVILIFIKFNTISGNIETQAMMYLQKYGHMNKTNNLSIISERALQNAVKTFQIFAGIKVTGILDEATVKTMSTPRCGLRDGTGRSFRRNFEIGGGKWKIRDITYKISKYPSRAKNYRDQIDKEIARAFKMWSYWVPLNFYEMKSGPAHIDMRFESRDHGDGYPFDGPSYSNGGHELAHAFFPEEDRDGDIHFDDEEEWSIDTNDGINLLMVAIHEIGHALGLFHSSVKSAMMYPIYQRFKPNIQLDTDDINGIIAIYGSRSKGENVQDPPDLCKSASIDAITRTADGNTYIFKDHLYWRITKDVIENGYPRSILDWGDLPNNIDGVLTGKNEKTFFFKGDNYWRYTNMRVDSGYPKKIEVGLKEMLSSMETSLEWSGNGFPKGQKSWNFPSHLDNTNSDQLERSSSVSRQRFVKMYSLKCPGHIINYVYTMKISKFL